MDKTHNISLGGFAFHIDDKAYLRLERYLNDIRHSLHNNADVNEIMQDVEYRMGELLRERLSSREVVNALDIENLITTMGAPSDYANDEADMESENANAYVHDAPRGRKKLFRNVDDKILGGVASGLAEYLGWDRTWVRLAFVALPFMDFIFLGLSTTTVVLLYLALWLVVPEARTTAEKLQMRGEPVNFDSIKDFFGNSPDLNEKVQNMKHSAQRAAHTSGHTLGNILKVIIKIIAVLVIINLLIIALGFIIAFFAAIFGISILGLSGSLAGWAARDYLPYLFDGSWQQVVGIISLALVSFIPAIVAILLALRIISSRYRVHNSLKWGLPILFFIGLLGLTATFVSTASQFKRKASYIQNLNIPMSNDTLYIERDKTIEGTEFDDFFIQKDGKFAITANETLYVKKSDSPTAYLQVKIESRGRSAAEAESNARSVTFNYKIDQNKTVLDGHVFIPEGTQWRNQKVEVTLFLPENKIAAIRNFDVIYGTQDGNWNDFYDSNEHFYTFVRNSLTCLSCSYSTPNDFSATENVTIPKDTVIIIQPNQNSTHDSITSSAPSIND